MSKPIGPEALAGPIYFVEMNNELSKLETHGACGAMCCLPGCQLLVERNEFCGSEETAGNDSRLGTC